MSNDVHRRARTFRRSIRRTIWAAVAAVSASLLVATPAAAVPTPDTTDLVIGARVAYERVPDADLDNPAFLEGTTFELYTPGPAGPGTATGLTCVIPAGALDCTISVPGTGPGGVNEGAQFYVVTTSAGAAAQPISSLSTGISSDPANQRSYPGLTVPLFGNQTVAFPQQGSGETLNSTVVANALNNPAVTPVCLRQGPLELAVLMDLSGSVTELQRLQYRAAFTTMVEELEGLPIDLSLSTFGSSSPVDGRESGPYSLQDAADVAQVLADITAYTEAVPGATQQTNWDLALRRIADQPGAYDALLALTDGAPNWVSNDTGTGGVPVAGSSVTIASIEQAVFSANAVKAEGTRVLAMGVGNALTGVAASNLAAISGPTLNSDYFQGNWDTLTEDIRAAVGPVVGGSTPTCTVPVTVTKSVVDANGENPTVADGWEFSLAVSALTEGTTAVTGDSPQATGSGDNAPGEASWEVLFSEVDATATISVTETPAAGFTLVGTEYLVTHLDGTTTAGVGESTTLSIPGILPTDRIDIGFTNAPTAASFQIRKVLEGPGADLVPADATFEVDYAVNGVPADAPLVISADGTPVDGPELSVGDEVTFAEQAPAPFAGGEWGALPEIEPLVLGEEPVIVDVVNTTTLDAATFQVRKALAGSAADLVPDDTAFSFSYTVNGVPAAEPLVVLADGTVVDGPTLSHGDVVVVSESTPPAVDGVIWGTTPDEQTVTLDAEAETPVLTFTNTANPAGILPVTGLDASFLPVAAGLIVLLVGAALVFASRRRAALRI